MHSCCGACFFWASVIVDSVFPVPGAQTAVYLTPLFLRINDLSAHFARGSGTNTLKAIPGAAREAIETASNQVRALAAAVPTTAVAPQLNETRRFVVSRSTGKVREVATRGVQRFIGFWKGAGKRIKETTGRLRRRVRSMRQPRNLQTPPLLPNTRDNQQAGPANTNPLEIAKILAQMSKNKRPQTKPMSKKKIGKQPASQSR